MWYGGPRRRLRLLLPSLIVVAFCWSGVRWTLGEGHQRRVDGPPPVENEEDVRGSELLPREGKGRLPYLWQGPRAPSNDRERRWSEIPEYRPATDLVFFTHIHKTSGTSLSCLLANIFPREAVVPTSHPSAGLKVDQLKGHDEEWWEPFQLMFSHNRPNITDIIGVPATKTTRLLITVRNPLLHKASIFFENVCRFGLHIKNGTIDQEAATVERMTKRVMYSFCRDAELWVGSPQFDSIYRNFQASWLSYGAAEKHPCMGPQLEENIWRTGDLADPGGACEALATEGKAAAAWEEYFDREADAAIRRMEEALWVGVTERMEESACLLFLTLGKREREMPQYRMKMPRPISVWHQRAKDKAVAYEKADWRVFDAANEILDLRLWTARERLKAAGDDARQRLGSHCFDVLTLNTHGDNGDGNTGEAL